MALIRPTASAVFLAQNYIWVPTIATITAPLATEINGASSLDVTLMFFTDSADPSQTTNQVQRAQRIGDGAIYSFPGLTSYTWGDIKYAFNQQGASGSNERKAWVAFGAGAGASGFFVYRQAKANQTAPAAADKVVVFPVSIGPGLVTTEGDAEAAEGAVVHTVTITGPPAMDATVS